MQLTEFGKAVRKARIDAGVTLLDMANYLEIGSSFISMVERGVKKVPSKLVFGIESYFNSLNIDGLNLWNLAAESNNCIDITGHSLRQKKLLCIMSDVTMEDELLGLIEELLRKNSKLMV